MDICHLVLVTKKIDTEDTDLFNDGSIQGVPAKGNHDNTDN
jgi:hypothetical protein